MFTNDEPYTAAKSSGVQECDATMLNHGYAAGIKKIIYPYNNLLKQNLFDRVIPVRSKLSSVCLIWQVLLFVAK